MEVKNKTKTEEEYNELKRHCELFKILFPLPKTYVLHLKLQKILEKEKNKNIGYY